MDCFALRKRFYEKVPKNDLVIKNEKHMDIRMHRSKVAMTFFMGCEDPMKERLTI